MCQYGGGQVVSMLDFYSDDPSSNPAKAYCFFLKICARNQQLLSRIAKPHFYLYFSPSDRRDAAGAHTVATNFPIQV